MNKLLTREELDQFKDVAKIQYLFDHIEAQRELLEEYEQLFQLQHKRDMQLIERWRKEDPSRELVMPDRNDLTQWVADKLKAAEGLLEEAAKLLDRVYCDCSTECDAKRFLMKLRKGEK